MSRCTCPPADWPSLDCPTHGLYGERRFPPMDRHARTVRDDRGGPGRRETAAEVQRRLYLEAAADRVRVEAAGFRWPLRPMPPRGIGQR